MTNDRPQSTEQSASSERRFERALLATYEYLARLGHGGRGEIDRYGGVEAARRVLDEDRITDGFELLWQMGKLEMSVEALSLRTEFAPLFTDAQRRVASERLRARGFVPE